MENWNKRQLIACRELYAMNYKASGCTNALKGVPKTRDNTLVTAMAKAIGRRPKSVWARMSNFAYLNPMDSSNGLSNAGRTARKVWHIKFGSAEYLSLLREACLSYPGIASIIHR